VITLVGNATVTHEKGDTYTDEGASAVDNTDGDITSSIVIVNSVDVNTVGVYTVTYNVSDAAGNAATELTRTVNVVDTIAPVITLVGNATVTHENGDTYTDTGASASDHLNVDLTSSIVIVNPVDVNTVGDYMVTYNVSDAAGNAATEVTRTVNVVDTIAPVITLIGDAIISLELGTVYADDGATAVDNTDGDITSDITTVNPVNVNTVGDYTVTYNVSDAAGNASTEVTRTVRITLPSSICFPAGTPVCTDQGEIDIDKIDPEKHTINAHKIEGITETTSIENYVVMIEKHAFARNVPSCDTIISANHKIRFNNHMVQAREFLDKCEFNETIYKMEYTGETLYNVLLEDKHCVMVVNNLIAETLSPTSVNAWLFRILKSDISNAERKEVMDAYMQRVFPAPVLSSFMIGCK